MEEELSSANSMKFKLKKAGEAGALDAKKKKMQEKTFLMSLESFQILAQETNQYSTGKIKT